jgi:hypothetical protein
VFGRHARSGTTFPALTTSPTLFSTKPTIIIVRSSVFHNNCIVLSTTWNTLTSYARWHVSVRKDIPVSGQGGSLIHQA